MLTVLLIGHLVEVFYGAREARMAYGTDGINRQRRCSQMCDPTRRVAFPRLICDPAMLISSRALF